MKTQLFFLICIYTTIHAPVRIVSVVDLAHGSFPALRKTTDITLSDDDYPHARPACTIRARDDHEYTLWIDRGTLWYCAESQFFLRDPTPIRVAYQHTITPLLSDLDAAKRYDVVITITASKLCAAIQK